MIYILYAFVRSLCLGLFVLRYPVLTLQSVSSMGEVTSAAVILFVPSVVSGSELGFTSSRATQLLPPHPPETDGDGDVVDPNRRSALLRRNRLAVKKKKRRLHGEKHAVAWDVWPRSSCSVKGTLETSEMDRLVRGPWLCCYCLLSRPRLASIAARGMHARGTFPDDR